MLGDQWSFLVPLIGGRYHIITQLAMYKWYISGIYCQVGDYMVPTHLLKEPETAMKVRVASLMVLIKQVDSEVPCTAFSENQSILNAKHIQLSTIIIP